MFLCRWVSRLALMFLVTTSCATLAQAAEPAPNAPMTEHERRDKAKIAYKGAEHAFDRGRYEAALTGYRTAAELVPAAVVLARIAVCLDKLGRAPEAIAAYQAFLEYRPDPERHRELIEEAQRRIAALTPTP